MDSTHLSVWEILPWCQTFQFLPLCCWCLSSCYTGARAQMEWVWVSLCGGSLRGTAWDSRCFLHLLNPHWFLWPKVTGTYLAGTGTLDWGAWCGAGTPCSQDIPPEFLSTTCGCGNSPLHISTLPTGLDGCGSFNFVVVRPPFNLTSDGSEWWLFCILVIILLWLCKKGSHVYLCHHLDQQLYFPIHNTFITRDKKAKC